MYRSTKQAAPVWLQSIQPPRDFEGFSKDFRMTLCRLYAENGNRAGFWVQHRSWSNICARVDSIHGQEFGRLPAPGPLQFDPALLNLGYFDVRSGRPSELEGTSEHLIDRSFVMIAQPPWYSDAHARRQAAKPPRPFSPGFTPVLPLGSRA
jgi:hypothetical protein